MDIITPSSRREFIKKGGVIVAAASALSAGGHIFATGKREDEENEEMVSPAEDLMREHGVLKRVLLVYGEAIRRIEGNEDLPPEAVGDSARIVRRFIEDYTRSSRKISFSLASGKRTSSRIWWTCWLSSIRAGGN